MDNTKNYATCEYLDAGCTYSAMESADPLGSAGVWDVWYPPHPLLLSSPWGSQTDVSVRPPPYHKPGQPHQKYIKIPVSPQVPPEPSPDGHLVPKVSPKPPKMEPRTPILETFYEI